MANGNAHDFAADNQLLLDRLDEAVEYETIYQDVVMELCRCLRLPLLDPLAGTFAFLLRLEPLVGEGAGQQQQT